MLRQVFQQRGQCRQRGRIARQAVEIGRRQHRFGAARVADADFIADFRLARKVDRWASVIVNRKFDVHFRLFRAHGANGIGAHDRAHGVRGPARAVFGQRRQIRLSLVGERQKDFDVRSGGVGRVVAQIGRGKGDAAQVRRNVLYGADGDQVGARERGASVVTGISL